MAVCGYLYLGLAAHWRGEWDEAERHLRRPVEPEPRERSPGRARPTSPRISRVPVVARKPPHGRRSA